MNYILYLDQPAAASSAELTGHEDKQSRRVSKIGLDVHAQSYVAVRQQDHATPGAARRFAPPEFLPWVCSLLAAGEDVHVVYESCGFGFGLYRALLAAGAKCSVISPQTLDEGRSGVKTDGRDALALCQALERYLQGNAKALRVIRVPSEEEEQRRHISRQREQLVRHRAKLQAQGRALLVNHTLPAPAHWWMAQTWGRLHKHLPDWVAQRLEVTRPMLLAFEQQIGKLSAQLEALAVRPAPRGLGKLTSVILGNEVCDWKRFKNRRQMSGYTGLCPREYTSGDKRKQGSVSKRGNPRLRAALVEGAWRLVRFQPQYPPIKKRLHVLSKDARATGASRKKAIVAVARRLAVDLWRLHTGQCTAQHLGLLLSDQEPSHLIG